MILNQILPMSNSDQSNAQINHLLVKPILDLQRQSRSAFVQNCKFWFMEQNSTKSNFLFLSFPQNIFPIFDCVQTEKIFIFLKQMFQLQKGKYLFDLQKAFQLKLLISIDKWIGDLAP
jgi:hypothetical protein